MQSRQFLLYGKVTESVVAENKYTKMISGYIWQKGNGFLQKNDGFTL